MTAEIQKLDKVDMTSDERREFYVVEWVDAMRPDEPTTGWEVFYQQQSRDEEAAKLAGLRTITKTITYTLVGDGYADLSECVRYVEANPRINEV